MSLDYCVGKTIQGDVEYTKVWCSSYCRKHEKKYWCYHSDYKGVRILQGMKNTNLSEATHFYASRVETTMEREVILFADNLDTIREMIRAYQDGTLTWVKARE